jgi:hypothetical protein
MDVRGSDNQEPAGGNATPIILASVLAVVLFASIVTSISLRKRAKAMAADLETARAELGVQQARAVSLQQEVNRRDIFIDRNVLQDPDVYSAAPPIQSPEPIQSQDPFQEEVHSDPFAVGSDEESSEDESDDSRSDEESSDDESDDGNSSDDDESAESSAESSSLDLAGELPQSPTAMSAVRVRPNEIKTITVLPKGCTWLSEEFGLGTTITQDCQPSKDDLWHEVKMEELPEEHTSWTLPQQNDSQAQVGCYWGEDTVESSPQEVPSLVADEGPAEVQTTTTEVDRAETCNKDAGAMPAPMVSSGSGSPPGGPDTPESFMSPPVTQACHYPLPW